jgi:hypothetical protein
MVRRSAAMMQMPEAHEALPFLALRQRELEIGKPRLGVLGRIRRALYRAIDMIPWEEQLQKRVEALEGVLGKCDRSMYHPPEPLWRDGFSDVLRFPHFSAGTTYVTCDLIADPRQVTNALGHFELMMVTPQDDDWAPQILSRVAKYSRSVPIEPGEVMELGTEAPGDTQIKGLLFTTADIEPKQFQVLGVTSSLLLCVGITTPELEAARVHGALPLLHALREKRILPFTDRARASII